MADSVKFTATAADSFRSALNSAGWLGGEVEAACILRQGESPSLTSAMLGVGLFKLFKPKGMKELPRKFVLAVTPDRAVAFGASAHSEGDGSSGTYIVTVKPGELGSWSRRQVSMRPSEDGITSNAELAIEGTEFRCAVPDSDAEGAFSELEAALSSDSAPA